MDYYAITRDMTQLGLKGSRLTVYALVYKFSSDGQSSFFGSLSYVSEWCGISRPQAAQILRDLTDEGYITRDDSSGRPRYKVADVRKTECSENRTLHSEIQTRCSENRTPSYNREDNRTINKDSHSITRTREEIAYGDKVRMTAEEHDKLVKQYGEEDAAALCEILDDHMCATGATYKSHYRAIKKWCVDKLTERKAAQLRLKNAQQPRTNAAPAAPAGNYAGLAEARARLKAIQDKYKN